LTGLDHEEIKKDLMKQFVKPMNDIIEVNRPFRSDIMTKENRLYRKLLQKALEEPIDTRKINIIDDMDSQM
jgi:hypothetical protein